MSKPRPSINSRVLAACGLAICFVITSLPAQERTALASTMAAKACMKGLEIAIKGFQKEYGHLPGVAVLEVDPVASHGDVLAALLGGNPRKINFWSPPPRNPDGSGAAADPNGIWDLRDPWGHFYRLHLDKDGDGEMPNPAAGSAPDQPKIIQAPVLIYSAGPDGDFTTWKDNVCSWK